MLQAMITDCVFEPFGADAGELVRAARDIDRVGSGFDGVWVYDHFTAMFSTDRDWSRDPWALLGAYAAVTDRIRIGTLVANVYNRTLAQLASAVNTVQSIAGDPTRVVCGLGSGAAPNSRFAAEHDAVGIALADGVGRRRRLIDTIEGLDELWQTNRRGAVSDVVDGTTRPRIIIGASGPDTVRLAIEYADGVNIRDGRRLEELVAIVQGAISSGTARPDFELSVLTAIDFDHPLGGDVERLERLGVARRILGVRSPFDLTKLLDIGGRIATTIER